MAKRFRVALLIESSRSYGRQLLKGIAAYGRAHAHWTFLHQERLFADLPPPGLSTWRPDGIIARLANDELTRRIRRLHLPTVDLYPENKNGNIPSVASDPDAIICMAIEHFLERGFTNFAYCGLNGVPFSEMRAVSFQMQLKARGLHGSVFSYPTMRRQGGLTEIEAHALQHADRLIAWLQEQPKPLALIVCNDMRGQQVLSACAEAGIAVPDEVAVLGIDNDDVQCELCDPPLSSIDLNVESVGYQAAEMLDRLMGGESLRKSQLLLPPRGVVVRQSTDVLAVADADMAEIIRYVREHACDGIAIQDVMEFASISRSTLERWFERWVGRSPAAEIGRVQVQRVQELLQSTSFTLEEISRLAGFTHIESMQRIFKRTVGQTPGQYRKQVRQVR